MWVFLVSNYAFVRILVLRFVIPYASTKVNSCAMKLHPTCGALFGVSFVQCLFMWIFIFFVGCFSIYLLAFPCTKWEYYLCNQILKPKVVPNESIIPPIHGISMSLQVNLYVPTLIFKINFFFVCPCRSWSGRGWPIFFHARCVILTMSVYSLVIAQQYDKGIRDAQSRNEKWIYFMLSNNKFLGKCWCGRHPWIWLAMESESMVEKGTNFIFCLGTAYGYLAWKVLGITRSFSLTGKVCLSNFFISHFKLWALAPLQIPTSLCEGPFYLLYAIFIFIWVSIFSYKEPTTEHYYHTWALDVVNIWMCCMNGSMIEHDGLGIICLVLIFGKTWLFVDMFEY